MTPASGRTATGPVAVLTVALACAVTTFVADLVAVGVGVQRGAVVGLTIRTLLVAVVMLVVAARAAARRDRVGFPSPEVLGLCLGWALNPFSWIGRSYVGQWWSDATPLLTATVDLVGWVATAALVGWLVQRSRTGAGRPAPMMTTGR